MTYRARCEGRRVRQRQVKLARDRRAYVRWRTAYDADMARLRLLPTRGGVLAPPPWMTAMIWWEQLGPMNRQFRTWEEKQRGVPPPAPRSRIALTYRTWGYPTP